MMNIGLKYYFLIMFFCFGTKAIQLSGFMEWVGDGSVSSTFWNSLYRIDIFSSINI